MWRMWSVVFTLFLITRPLFPLVDYAVNYNYITTVLCENKAKPELHCNGKCQLMKELAKASEPEKTSPEPSRKFPTLAELFFGNPTELVARLTFSSALPILNFTYGNLYFFQNTGSFFRPPALI